VNPVRRQRSWGAAALFAGAAVLAGCQQPTPGVTFQSGSRVVRSEATLYVRDGKQITGSRGVKVLAVHPGALVGVDVDRSLATKGWSVHITTGSASSDTLTSPVLHGQHFSFNVGSVATDVVVSEQGTGTTPSGLWAFTLQPTLQ
jgi:hypothetical protein